MGGSDGIKPTQNFDFRKVSQEMINKVKSSIQGGKTDGIDNSFEYNRLSRLLANTKSLDEQMYIKGFQFEYTQKQASDYARGVVENAAARTKGKKEINDIEEAKIIANELNNSDLPEADKRYYETVLENSGFGYLIPKTDYNVKNMFNTDLPEGIVNEPLHEVVTEDDKGNTINEYYDGNQLVRKEEYDSYGHVVQFTSYDSDENLTYMEKNIRNSDGTYTRYSSIDGKEFSENETYTVDGEIISQPNEYTTVDKSFFEKQ